MRHHELSYSARYPGLSNSMPAEQHQRAARRHPHRHNLISVPAPPKANGPTPAGASTPPGSTSDNLAADNLGFTNPDTRDFSSRTTTSGIG
jgi:hypothetical protein